MNAMLFLTTNSSQQKDLTLSKKVTERLTSAPQFSIDMRKSITQVLDNCGWATYQTAVMQKDGRKHTAYAVEPYPQNLNGIKPVSYNSLIEALKQNFKNVWRRSSFCQYAPEIKKSWIVAW